MIFDFYDDYSNSLSSNIGELTSMVIAMDDDFGYCIKDITVTISENVYQFSSDEYFGNGIIISSACDYSFRYLSDNLPLISCHDDYLELFTYKTRGIYTLDIHTCIADGSDMTFSNMKDNVYSVCDIISDLQHENCTKTKISFEFRPRLTKIKNIFRL